jgi:hypothetical protein
MQILGFLNGVAHRQRAAPHFVAHGSSIPSAISQDLASGKSQIAAKSSSCLGLFRTPLPSCHLFVFAELGGN